ncbi:hypothetical protein IV102_11445 [bacterium]|nr:hypothetical protein [bacterium]
MQIQPIKVSRTSAPPVLPVLAEVLDTVQMGSTHPADPWRQAARLRLSHPISSEVELTGLALFEKSLLAAPSELVKADRRAENSLYVGALASLAGLGNAGLSPAVMHILDDFHCWKQTGRLRTLGECADQVVAARSAGPSVTLDSGLQGYGLPLHGPLSDHQVANVEMALQEIVRKTDSKALHLVKEIYLRPFLAESVDAHGEARLVDGLAHGRGQVGLLNATAQDLNATRTALFHELGHELDHILSGGTTFFRSSQSDSPFGQGDSVSAYAGTNAAEDFAETHATLIEDWDKIRACPDLFIHGRGQVGQKLAWIWQKGYREPLPHPSASWQAAQQDMDGQQLQQIAADLRSHWPHPQGEQEQQLWERLTQARS